MSFSKILILLLIIRLTETRIYPCSSGMTCGCSSKTVSTSRIVGGRETDIKIWPWTVSINVDGRELCGGTILSSQWIVTAAHCASFGNLSKIIIHAGSTYRWTGVQQRNVSKAIIHSQYQADTFMNDIALLELAIPLDMDAADLMPICLPNVDTESMKIYEWPEEQTPVAAVGWGRLYDNGPWTDQLREVSLRITDIETPTCQGLIIDQQGQLCAGIENGGKDTCAGDSGGPLMMLTTSKQWVLVGITSFGFACALPGFPGVYTRVANYHDWIQSKTNETFPNLCKNSLIMKKSSGFLDSYASNISYGFYTLFSSFLLLFYHSRVVQFS